MPRIPTPYEEQIRDSAYRQGMRDGRNNMRDAFTRDLARDLLLAEVRRNGVDFHDLGEAGKLAFQMADEFSRNMAAKIDAKEAADAAAANEAQCAAIAAEEAADKAERAHTRH